MPIYDACPDADCQAAARQRQLAHDLPAPQDESTGRTSPSTIYNPYYTGHPRTPLSASRSTTVDRQEIIRRIKNRDDRSRPTSPEIERQIKSGAWEIEAGAQDVQHGEAHDSGANMSSKEHERGNMDIGMQIERPKSALHRGDFRESVSGFNTAQPADNVFSTSPPVPWRSDLATSAFRQAWDEHRIGRRQATAEGTVRQRPFSSIAHPFLYQAPTSPLVQSSRPDTPPPQGRSSRSPDKTRRHTFSPHALARFASEIEGQDHIIPSLRKEATYPYQAHQPRRSQHAINAISLGSPPRSAFSSRRPSASEAQPLVGSYEESILRGRMSTTPSKPLNFIAQIGVLGKGTCKSFLRCPSHVTIPFPAVFYSYNANTRSTEPSPYVGLVDLEHGLPSHDDVLDRRRQRLGERLQAALSDEGSRANSKTREDSSDTVQAKRRKQQKAKRRSNSPKAPPGGSYRIPQQGQLQIVIKNPNKTAVKLFLVPYDLSDMTPGQKTFIRQRSYSAGPILDMPVSSRKNLGTDRPEASLTNSDDPSDRPVLRYLVHLHICCTGKGRYWLYKSIRVVFANRVPDGKEKLRNEIQLPEPRYSAYKAGRNSTGISSTPDSPSAAAKRTSMGEALGDAPTRPVAASLPTTDFAAHDIGTFRFPFRAPLLPSLEPRPSSNHATDMMDVDSDRTRSETGPLSPTSSFGTVDRTLSPPLREHDEVLTFGRDRSHERTEGGFIRPGESLLSQKLRKLDM